MVACSLILSETADQLDHTHTGASWQFYTRLHLLADCHIMHSPNPSFEASGFIRKFSLRKKKWPDDYVITRGRQGGITLRKPGSPPASTVFTFSCFSPTVSTPSILPRPLTSRAFVELRAQFSEQLKCLDSKLDLDVTVMSELHEFYRRRALVEQEYSDALAKLVSSLKHKHSNETGKRSNWINYTTTTLWNTLLGTTLRLSDAHATLSDIFSKHMVQRLVDLDEDANRLHKQCREMMMHCQEKVFANITKLQSDQREYGQRQSTQTDTNRICKRSEEKLTAALNSLLSKKKEPEKSQKFRRIQSDYNQKYQAFENTVLATNHARNECLIQLCAANQSVQRYFTDEVSDILDCMSCGLHNSLARTAMMHLSSEEAVKNCHASVGEMINRNITALDWRADKATFLQRNEIAFSRPPIFSFMPFKDDTESEVTATPPLCDSLAATAVDLRTNLNQLKSSTELAWNNLQEIEKKLLVLINQNDYDVSELFADPTLLDKRRRRRSVSPSDGEPARPMPGSPPANTALPDFAASYTSFKGSGGSGTALFSSSLPAEEMGFNTDIQPGLYLAMRNTYREQRIKEERIYMERFSIYTQEMHRFVVMQAKLAEIERALASQRSKTSSKKGPSLITPSSYCSTAPGGGSGDAELLRTSSIRSFEKDLEASPPSATTSPSTAVQPAALVKMATRRVLQVPNVGRPKLFGGTIDEYVTKTGEQIPRIILSCIRVINLYGMHHQGVFRVPGSQTEINTFKEAFEYGEDPLIGLSDAREINSATGLLKLYFRELGEPLFPKKVFTELIKTVREKRDLDECVHCLASIISSGLSRCVFIVMRYLFAFLNHLAEYSDENMMDPYNLAICFGPTLMPSPPDLDQVESQSNVNDVIKLCIKHHRRIFDPTVPGAYYEKFAAYASSVPPVLPRAIASEAVKKACSLRHQVTAPAATMSVSAVQETPENTSYHNPSGQGTYISPTMFPRAGGKQTSFSSSIDRLPIDGGLEDDNNNESGSDIEDDYQPLLAKTLADFVGTSARELSFQRGEELLLYRRLNKHWWEGQPAAKPEEGSRFLVPHLYIKLSTGNFAFVPTLSCTPDPIDSSSPNKAQRQLSADFGRSSPPGAPILATSSAAMTSDSHGEVTRITTSTSTRSLLSTLPSDPKSDTIENGVKETHSLKLDKKDVINAVTSTPLCENGQDREEWAPTSASSIMIRSTSYSPPSKSSQCKAGNRCSWTPTFFPSSTLSASTVANLETLPENKSASIRPSVTPLPTKFVGDMGKSSTTNGSLNEVDSALAEVMRGLVCLEKDRYKGPKVNTIAEQRSRELEQKMRLPSAAKHTLDIVIGIPDCLQSSNGDHVLGKSSEEDFLASSTNAADMFAEQADGTVRKRLSTQLATSASINTDHGQCESIPKPVSDTATWRCTRKLSSHAEDVISKSSEGKSAAGIETESPILTNRRLIAARVAAFEASNDISSANASSIRPSWMRKA